VLRRNRGGLGAERVGPRGRGGVERDNDGAACAKGNEDVGVVPGDSHLVVCTDALATVNDTVCSVPLMAPVVLTMGMAPMVTPPVPGMASMSQELVVST
jgi:hypothetical protein